MIPGCAFRLPARQPGASAQAVPHHAIHANGNSNRCRVTALSELVATHHSQKRSGWHSLAMHLGMPDAENATRLYRSPFGDQRMEPPSAFNSRSPARKRSSSSQSRRDARHYAHRIGTSEVRAKPIPVPSHLPPSALHPNAKSNKTFRGGG